MMKSLLFSAAIALAATTIDTKPVQAQRGLNTVTCPSNTCGRGGSRKAKSIDKCSAAKCRGATTPVSGKPVR